MAAIVLAYVLALNALLSGISSAAHASEARLAAQLGVICTTHAAGSTDQPSQKPACAEHCVPASASVSPGGAGGGAAVNAPDLIVRAARAPFARIARVTGPVTPTAMPRGPPAIS